MFNDEHYPFKITFLIICRNSIKNLTFFLANWFPNRKRWAKNRSASTCALRAEHSSTTKHNYTRVNRHIAAEQRRSYLCCSAQQPNRPTTRTVVRQASSGYVQLGQRRGTYTRCHCQPAGCSSAKDAHGDPSCSS